MRGRAHSHVGADEHTGRNLNVGADRHARAYAHSHGYARAHPGGTHRHAGADVKPCSGDNVDAGSNRYARACVHSDPNADGDGFTNCHAAADRHTYAGPHSHTDAISNRNARAS